MSSLADVRDAIVTGLAADARLSGVNISVHGGDFTLDDLLRYSKKSPALVLALLRYTAVDTGGVVVAKAIWGLAALVRNTATTGATDLDTKKDAAVIALADRATRALVGIVYGVDDPTPASTAVSTPRNFVALNMYTPELDEEGVAMIGMQWEQEIDLVDVDVDALDDFITAHVDYETHTRPGETVGEVPEATDDITDLNL